MQNKLKNKKNIVIFSSIIIFFLTAFITGKVIFAYLTDTDEINSGTVDFGSVNIQINENYDPSVMYTPGNSITKEPWVTNIGTAPCYVRIRADINDGLFAPNVTLDIDQEHWTTKQADGYYYYKGFINPCSCDRESEDYDPSQECLTEHHRTENLFNTVSIAEIQDKDIKNFYIYVYAEAIPIASCTDLYDNAIEGWNLYCNRTEDDLITIDEEYNY